MLTWIYGHFYMDTCSCSHEYIHDHVHMDTWPCSNGYVAMFILIHDLDISVDFPLSMFYPLVAVLETQSRQIRVRSVYVPVTLTLSMTTDL